jgi:perosamine synthetase
MMELPWPYFGASYGEEEPAAVAEMLAAVAASRRPLDRRSPEIGAFEEAFAVFVGAQHAVALSSGGAALAIGARLLGIGPGDEVPTTALTFKATVLPILELGGRPVPVEVDTATLNLDPADVAAKIGPRTKAIFAMDYAGLPCDIEEIAALAAHAPGGPLPVLDDAAHAVGAERGGRRVGGLADLTCFSFQSQKNMTTLGEGGMLTTNDAALGARARELRNFASDEEIGANLRMTPAQAAVGLVQVRKLDAVNARRRAVALALRSRLASLPDLSLPPDPDGVRHVHHLFPILLPEGTTRAQRDRVMHDLQERFHVTTAVMYEPWYRLPIFRAAGYAEQTCPRTEALIDRLLNLPLHPDYSAAQIDYLADAVREALGVRR